jgi:hypothetical protein
MVPRALAEQRKEEEKARIMFRALYRLMFVEKGGRPKYPEFTWTSALEFVERYKQKSDD